MLKLNFTPFPDLNTERLNLRLLQLSDCNEIFFLRTDEHVNKYIDRAKANSLDDAKKFIEKINDGIRKNDAMFWAITLKDNLKLIGTVSLWNISIEYSKAEIGYELLPQFQGKGIMHEAIAKVIQFGFENMKLQTIEAFTHLENIQSAKLLEKSNFTRDTKFEIENAGSEELKNMIVYSLNKFY